MTIWVDAQLSPAIAKWISDNFPVSAQAVRGLGLRDATDQQIFAAAKNHLEHVWQHLKRKVKRTLDENLATRDCLIGGGRIIG